MIVQVEVLPIEEAPKDGSWFWALGDAYGCHPGQPIYVRWLLGPQFWYDAYNVSRGVSHFLPNGFPSLEVSE